MSTNLNTTMQAFESDAARIRARSMACHPSGSGYAAGMPRTAILPAGATHDGVDDPKDRGREDGSLVTEYGLLAVVAATIAGVVISWASNGALVSLFNALLRQARSLVGA